MYVISLRDHPTVLMPGGRLYHTPASAETALYEGLSHYWAEPWSWEVRPATWREREAAMFSEGVYQRPVWAHEKFWTENAHVHADHFAHISVDDPAMIAFTESPEKGEANRQTRIKPGKYLKRFFGDVLSDRKIAFYAEWFQRGQRPTEQGQLAFADTEDAIIDVYANGPASCMQGEDCVRVYAAGDLAVAYMSSETRGVFARALCWPAKKVYGRVYPTPDRWRGDGFESYAASEAAQGALADALRAHGYTSLAEDRDGFDGARLQAIEVDDGYAMPYLDNHYGVDFHGTHFTMSRHGDYACDETSGYIELEPRHEYGCELCGDGCDDVVTVYDGWHPTRGAFGGEDWCDYCANQRGRTFYCDATGEHYDNREADYVVSEGGQTWIFDWAELNAYHCDAQEVWVTHDSDPAVTMADGEVWARSYFEANGFTCAHDGENYAKDDESETFPGYHSQYDNDASAHPELELEAA